MPLASVTEQVEGEDDDDDGHGGSEVAEAEEGQGSRCLVFSGPRQRPLSGTTHLSIPSRTASSADLGSRAARKVGPLRFHPILTARITHAPITSPP